jgi:biopolymer transport protein ExbD
MKFERNIKGKSSIPTASMGDIVFLLLIFFMVTTVFRRPLAMEINMPESEATIEVPESNVMSIFIDHDEAMFFKIGKTELAPITWPDLEPTFLANSKVNPNLIILVKIHRKARYEPMVDMMDTLEDAHMERFSLIPMNEADAAMLEAMR